MFYKKNSETPKYLFLKPSEASDISHSRLVRRLYFSSSESFFEETLKLKGEEVWKGVELAGLGRSLGENLPEQ